ncbi:MAG: hypothetical protein EOS81_10680 [Mesorhizobium sp.]|nr:hypothetical protein EJ072_32370 [Mesorhizobium sp. M2A.F.Ca.ET.046.03.2.1]RVC65052.1 hypothetical protein EN766_35075 [Mesorhizobium sp. M2A.F.Ca.ET.046.02.1.1]RVC66838.1 hypothetical protein EN759_17485 [Mesorhizobium sp. M00.F.Ca.ET.038.03.1.1]RWB37667.1 MAG: hypothetical protein EOQ44_32880 [Mesorhizobium sp.]RWE17938.1 MAG: hypothetical protein EOS76_17795 [Mesorhizobium sp.]
MNLLDWNPPCQVIAFPLVSRVGRIREVATKMLAKSTDRHAESYRDQVTTGLLGHLGRLGISESEQDEQLGAFWAAVQAEIIRQTYQGGQQPGGSAA